MQRVLLLSFVCWLTACRTVAPPPPTKATDLPPFQVVTIGLCEDYAAASRSLTAARQDLEFCRQAGAKVLRIAFSWAEMEPTAGTIDFSFWDEFVRLAVDEFQIRLIPYICYTPEWNASVAGQDFWRSPPRQNAAFARFVAALVDRYKDRIHSWELWNEPDNREFWTGDAAQYAVLVRAGAAAVRATDPQAKVVLGGLAWNLDFLRDLLQTHQLAKHVDVVSFHAYFETWLRDPLEELTRTINRAHDLIAEHGEGESLWLAELGYSNYRRGGHVSDAYAARYAYEHTAEYQAQALLRTLTLAVVSGKVELIAWYRIRDLPAAQEIIGDVNNRYLGLVDNHGQPKPAFAAFRTFTGQLQSPVRSLDRHLKVVRLLGSATQVHVFEQLQGPLIVVAWLETNVAGYGKKSASGNQPDPREESLVLQLPAGNLAIRIPAGQTRFFGLP